MDVDEQSVDEIISSLRYVNGIEKVGLGGYQGYFSSTELRSRLAIVQQALELVKKELDFLGDHPLRERLLRRIEKNGRNLRYGTEEFPTDEERKEEELVMDRMAYMIRQESILTLREKDIIVNIRQNERKDQNDIDNNQERIGYFP
jgi:hypothetical protein